MFEYKYVVAELLSANNIENIYVSEEYIYIYFIGVVCMKEESLNNNANTVDTSLLGKKVLFDAGEVDLPVYNLVSDENTTWNDFNALYGIGDRFSRNLRLGLQHYIRTQPRVTMFPPEMKTFQEYINISGSFLSMSMFHSAVLKGSLSVVLHPDLVNFVVNCYFGGSNKYKSRDNKSEFTATEERIIYLLSTKLGAYLETSWSEVCELDLKLTTHETNPMFAFLCDSNDIVVVCKFSVQVVDSEPLMLDIVYPYLLFKPILGLLRSSLQLNVAPEDSSWKCDLARAIYDIKLDVCPRISETTITFSELISLQAGSVLPLPKIEEVKIYIDNICRMYGALGSVGSQAAIEVTKIVTSVDDMKGIHDG